MIAGSGIEVCCDDVIGDIRFRRSIQVDIAVNATHVPGILSLQIGTIVIAHHLHGDVVLASTHHLRDIEFSIVVGSLRVAYVLTIYPDVGGTIDTIEVEHSAL